MFVLTVGTVCAHPPPPLVQYNHKRKNVPGHLQQCAPPPPTPDGRLPPHPLLAFARAAAPLDPVLAARAVGFEPGTSDAGAQGASTEARGTSPDIWSHKHTAMQPCQLARNTAIVYLPFFPSSRRTESRMVRPKECIRLYGPVNHCDTSTQTQLEGVAVFHAPSSSATHRY